MDTPDLMDTPGTTGPRRDPYRTVPPLCGDPDHRHPGTACAILASEEGLRATLREADEILERELVALPRHLIVRIPLLVAEVEDELDVDLGELYDTSGRITLHRAPRSDRETIVDGAGNPVREVRRQTAAAEAIDRMLDRLRAPSRMDENLTAVRAQSLQGLHAREAIDRLAGMDRVGGDVGRELGDVEVGEPDPDLAAIREEIGSRDPQAERVDRVARYLAVDPAATIAGVDVELVIVDVMPDGLIVTIRPR